MPDYKKSGGFGGGRRGAKQFGNNKRFGGSGGGSSFARKPGGRDFGPRDMFPATCSKCGNAFELPFRPSGDRPVFCRDCFGGVNAAGISTPRTDAAPRFEKRDFEKRDFAASAPSFAPASRHETPDARIDELKRQLDVVQSKLDRVLHLIEAKPSAAVAPKPVVAAVTVPSKPVAVTAKPVAKAAAKPVAKKVVAKKKK